MTSGTIRRAIARKRDGESLPADEWRDLIAAWLRDDMDDAQMAALAMACVLQGLSNDEAAALTDAFVASGDSIAFERPAVDKHSTGGVGDTVSLIAVPVVAACGVPVAKLSGRALGHTGGTLDKLEAIPGVSTQLEPDAFRAQVDRIGCAIAGQSERLVPADRRMYALRDRTATVPSVGLIAASIVSKKIAGGAAGIVYDVKFGAGAFLADRERAGELAALLVDLTRRSGRRATAVVSAMDEPLGASIGAGIEAIEARDVLRGRIRDERLRSVTLAVAREMLLVGGWDEPAAATAPAAALDDGSAYDRFVAMIEAQGGTRAALEAMAPAAPATPIRAPRDGYVASIDVVALGEIARDAIAAGGPQAGLRMQVRLGDAVSAGTLLVVLHGAPGLADRVGAAFTIAARAPEGRPAIDGVLRDSAAQTLKAAGQ